MAYYFEKELLVDFDKAKSKIIEALKQHRFGILTEIDVQKTLKEKIDVDLYKYTILGACNPAFAHKAILAEENIGVLLPCNILIQQKDDDSPVRICAVNPMSSMSAVENPNLAELAKEVTSILQSVIDNL